MAEVLGAHGWNGGVIEPVPRFLGPEANPVLLSTPDSPRAALVVVHALGENRTGNAYLFAELARGLVPHGIATARFDLMGCGESTGSASLAGWGEQCASVLDVVRAEMPGVPVHWLARGASAALLPVDAGDVVRMALSPPTPEELALLVSTADNGLLVGRTGLPAEEALLWARLGADPSLIGGLELDAELVRQLGERLAEPRWDTELGPADRQPRVPSWIVVTESDPLVLLEAARFGLVSLLADHLG